MIIVVIFYCLLFFAVINDINLLSKKLKQYDVEDEFKERHNNMSMSCLS